ncbi:phage tail assembly chaperone [Verrucomicrobiales bacterium]|nr:phage tail assembly chaperone [Verrucomicrobiales bacterium]
MKTIYNKKSGEILGTVSGVNSSVENDDEGFLDGVYDALGYKVVNGQAVAKTDAEKQSYDNVRNAETINSLRDKRNVFLLKSDWTQSSDSPLTDAKKEEWRTYRQALRDLPTNTTDPANPIWPIQPS